VSSPDLLDEWADRYGQLHAGAGPSPASWISVPVLVASLLAMLWSLPLPAPLAQRSPMINWATLFLMAAFVYYCILSIPIATAGLAFMLVAAAPSLWFEHVGLPAWPLALGAFVPAFCWQLLMTRRATGSIRLIRNLQYLMLGPVWLLRAAFRRAGIAC
jgi:hypothetical protein